MKECVKDSTRWRFYLPELQNITEKINETSK
jgi:hypothetical protein